MMKNFVLSALFMILSAFVAFAEVPGSRLVPDYNRDGKIDEIDFERAAGGETFTIWLNDDDDAEGADDGAKAGDTNIDLHDVPGGNDDRDCADGEVNGRCDLLDFFPVLIDVMDVDGWKDMTWKLSSKSVNVVLTKLKADTAGDFHTKDVKGIDGDIPLYKASVSNLAEDDAELPEDGFLDEGRGVFLIEGAAIAEGGITLRGEKVGGETSEVTLDLRVKNVEEMYGWLNLRPGAKIESEEREVKREEPKEDNRHFVFVHGYNTNHEEARGNAAEFYKKLWQSGSDAMFTAVEWRGDQSKMDIFGISFSPNYHVNVENAFAAARPFADACKKLPGEKILVGHSLGNMLISSAITDYGLDYTKYVMLNAAVAREAYDVSAHDEDMVSILWTDADEEGEESLTNHLDRASRWYRNFADHKYDPYEYRRKLAWRGRFANLPRTVNYYSPTDNILKNPASDDPDDLKESDAKLVEKVGPLLEKTMTLGGFWSLSEKLKGRPTLIETVNGVLTNLLRMAESDAYRCEGGWGENDDYVEGVPFSPTNTHFTPFLDERMKTIGMLDILPAETERLRAQHLADAIPAESFAAGANPVATLENVNEESFIGENPDWPVCEGDEVHVNEWKHSTFREVAFYHTSKFYKSIAAVGKPRIIIDMKPEPLDKDALFTLDLAERMDAVGKLGVLAVMTNGVDEAVARYRQLLGSEALEGRKVIICSIGSSDVLETLLKSAGDGYSGLSGMELVEKAVKELRVVDMEIAPQNWPTPVIAVSADKGMSYKSEDILGDFPPGTLSPKIRMVELEDQTGAMLLGPLVVLPLTEGEQITNQMTGAILNRLREIYRMGNPSMKLLVSGKPEPGLDYNGSELVFKFENIQSGRYAEGDLKFTFTIGDAEYSPAGSEWDETLGVLSVRFEISPGDVTAGNVYLGNLSAFFENAELGTNLLVTAKRQLVQGDMEVDSESDWFYEAGFETPTNYVPTTEMPERVTARVKTTVNFTGGLFEERYLSATGAAQAAVRIVDDGADGHKFQFYAFAVDEEESLCEGWWDCNVSNIVPVVGNDYEITAELIYPVDAQQQLYTVVFFVKNAKDNRPAVSVFLGNMIDGDGGIGNAGRLGSVAFTEDGEVLALEGFTLVNKVDANLTRVDGVEYPSVAESIAEAAGRPIRLLHAASWKPTTDDIGKPVKFLNKNCLVLDLGELPANAQAVWSDVDGNNGTLKLELVFADTVVYGTIRTAEDVNPVAEAIAIKDGKYVYVGDEQGVAAFIEDGITKIIDHRGKGMVMPGCTDGHSHYTMKFGLDNMKGGVVFALEDDTDKVLQKVDAAARAAAEAGKQSLFGFGWNIIALRITKKPTLADLDKVTHGVSTVIFDQAGHSAFCNTECLKRCRILSEDGKTVLIKEIAGGLLELDKDGRPTGYVDERVTGYLTRMGGINADEIVDDEVAETTMRVSQELLLSTGYTIAMEGWSNMLHPRKLYEAAHRMDTNGVLKLVFPMTYEVEPWQTNMTEQIEYLASLKETYGTRHVLPEYLKIFMDGVVETKTGALSKPYKDGTDYKSFWSTNRLADITKACNAKGLTVHTHVMGDAAIKETTDAYIQGGDGTNRNCLVHLRNVRPEEFQRFAGNNIACTAGFTWHVANSKEVDEQFAEFLDEEYIKHAYPMKSFFDAGVKVSSHSDFPANKPCPQDPFGIMQVAVTGQDPNLPADKKFPPYDTNELVSVEQAFRALTINGAWQVGLENERGSIKVGKYADFVLANQDVFTCAVTNIHKTKVVSTWFEGEKVYEASVKIKLTKALQRYPWNGIVDFCYEVENPELAPMGWSYKLAISLMVDGVTKAETNDITLVAGPVMDNIDATALFDTSVTNDYMNIPNATLRIDLIEEKAPNLE